jgi:hypothetical protein
LSYWKTLRHLTAGTDYSLMTTGSRQMMPGIAILRDPAVPRQPLATPARTVCAWPPLMWKARCTPELHFVHLDTRVLTLGGPSCLSSGETLWGNPKPYAAGVAWEWVQLRHGVYAMADPMGLITNLRLVGADGQTLTNTQMALHLNQLVHTLPWQDEVLRVLECSDRLPTRHH